MLKQGNQMAIKTYSNDFSEVYACDQYSRVGVGVHDKAVPDGRARYAMDLMGKLGMSMLLDGHPGAEVKTTADIAKTACDASDALHAEMEKRGWMITVPGIETLADEQRENRGRN